MKKCKKKFSPFNSHFRNSTLFYFPRVTKILGAIKSILLQVEHTHLHRGTHLRLKISGWESKMSSYLIVKPPHLGTDLIKCIKSVHIIHTHVCKVYSKCLGKLKMALTEGICITADASQDLTVENGFDLLMQYAFAPIEMQCIIRFQSAECITSMIHFKTSLAALPN